MAQGLFTLRQQVQGIVQKAWNTPVGTYAGSFNGSSQRLTLPALTSLTGNFTVEFYCNSTGFGTGDATVFSNYSATSTASEVLIIQRQTSGQWGVYCGSLSGAGNLTWTPTASSSNVWVHVALVRSGSTVTAYYNGVSVATATVSSTITLPFGTSIGAYTSGANFFLGYISNLRITNTVVYASNFSPPASPLAAITGTQLLTLQNATIVDNSTNAYTITNVGSVTTGAAMPFTQLKTPAVDYLVVAGGGGGGNGNAGGGGGAGGLLQGTVPVTAGSAITVTVGSGGAGGALSLSDNTLAGSVGQNSVFGSISATGGGGGGASGVSSSAGGSGGGSGGSANNQVGGSQGIAGQGNKGGVGNNINYPKSGGGGGAGTVGQDYYYNASGPQFSGNGGAGIASAISGTVSAYSGGGGGGGDYRGTTVTTTTTGGSGGGGAGSLTTTGTNGSPNTGGGGGGGGLSLSPTTFYAGGTGGSGIVIVSYPDIYAGAAATTGSPTVSTSGSGSMYGAGAGSLLYTGVNTTLTFAGDFTIEGWYNLANFNNAAGGGNPGLIGFGTSNWVLVIPGGQYYFYSGGSAILSSSSAVANANVWNHFALVRSGSSMVIYHNGVSVGTATNSSTISIGSSGVTVGSNGLSGTGSITGYMSNVRVVKGTAVYTSAFTPPTAPLTAIANTQLLLNTVSPNQYLDSSTNGYTPTVASPLLWNQASPFATGLGYKNRVYTWNSSGSITF
jgi:hypothetical protein